MDNNCGHCVHISYIIDSVEYISIKSYPLDSEGLYEIVL